MFPIVCQYSARAARQDSSQTERVEAGGYNKAVYLQRQPVAPSEQPQNSLKSIADNRGAACCCCCLEQGFSHVGFQKLTFVSQDRELRFRSRLLHRNSTVDEGIVKPTWRKEALVSQSDVQTCKKAVASGAWSRSTLLVITAVSPTDRHRSSS